MNAINSAVQAVLATKTYTNVVNMNAYGASNLISGGSTGNVIASTDGITYQYARTLLNTGNGKILMFPFVGEDGDIAQPAGSITRYEFDIQSRAWSANFQMALDTRTAVFVDASSPITNYTIHDHHAFMVNGKIRIYMTMANRDSYVTQVSSVFMIESTDGLIGKAFTAPQLIKPYYTGGQATVSGLISSGTAGVSWLIVAGDLVTRSTYAIHIDDATGLATGGSTTIVGAVNYIGEADFVRIDANRVIGVIRDNTGAGLKMVTTTDNFATPVTPVLCQVSGGGTVGISTGTKVTPKLRICGNNPNTLMCIFNDRGDTSKTKIVKASIANAFANVWEAPYTFGNSATQGNHAFDFVDETKGLFMVVGTLQVTNVVNPNVPSNHYTNLLWWLLQDKYSSVISPVPYQ